MSQYEKYDIIEIDRSQIKNADYNPRKIKPDARKKLKENLQKIGLLSPIIWNETTGNIVGGHQRIAAIDSLEKSKNYKLKVARVTLDEKTEKEQNIFLNNTQAQGEFDFILLQELYNDGVDFSLAGFDSKDVLKLFENSPEHLNADHLTELSEKIRTNTERRESIKKQSVNKDDPFYYSVLVFKNQEMRDTFYEMLGLEKEIFQNGETIMELIS